MGSRTMGSSELCSLGLKRRNLITESRFGYNDPEAPSMSSAPSSPEVLAIHLISTGSQWVWSDRRGSNSYHYDFERYMGVSKIQGHFLGVPMMRIMIYWSLFWGPLFSETPIFEVHDTVAILATCNHSIGYSWGPYSRLLHRQPSARRSSKVRGPFVMMRGHSKQ